MTKTQGHQAIVIGSGVIGLAVAHALARRGVRHALISPAQGTGVASLAAGAMVDAFGEMSELATEDDKARLEIEVAAQRRYPAWLEQVEADAGRPVFHTKGLFVVSNRDGTYDATKMRLIGEQLTAYQEPFERVAPDQVPGLHPNHDFPVHEAMFLPNALTVDTSELLPALEAGLARSGHSTRIDDRVSGVARNGVGWRVTTDAGTVVSGDSVIVCSGAQAAAVLGDALWRDAGLPKLYFGRGTACTLVDAPAVPYGIRTPNRILACGFHLLPRARGRLYIGATNWFGTNFDRPKGPSVGELHSLLDSAMNQLNSALYGVSIESTHWGLRPIAQFDRPIVGETQIPGLYIATGTHRTGVHLAPTLADELAAEWAGERGAEDSSFSPKHPAPAPATDLSRGVRALLAQALFPNGALPFNRIEELQVFMTELLTLALDDDADQAMRAELKRLLAEVAREEEGVLRLFHEVLERRLPERGPYPT